MSGGYLYNEAKVTEYEANPALVGKFLPQVPSTAARCRSSYANPRFANVALGVQFIGRQFDDDSEHRDAVPGQAEPGLPGFAPRTLASSRGSAASCEVFFGVQNLFDEVYYRRHAARRRSARRGWSTAASASAGREDEQATGL